MLPEPIVRRNPTLSNPFVRGKVYELAGGEPARVKPVASQEDGLRAMIRSRTWPSIRPSSRALADMLGQVRSVHRATDPSFG